MIRCHAYMCKSWSATARARLTFVQLKSNVANCKRWWKLSDLLQGICTERASGQLRTWSIIDRECQTAVLWIVQWGMNVTDHFHASTNMLKCRGHEDRITTTTSREHK